ncbi:MAG: GTPase HflX [Methanobacteriota archaeon]
MDEPQKNALIVSLTDDVSEITQLANSLTYHVVQVFIQHRSLPDVNTFAGEGKIEEMKKFIEEYEDEIELLIVNGELRPSQWFTLEKILQVTVYDRIRLILAIFEERAERREARLQVRLAQLHYERPFVRELIHRAKAGEHPGYMAGGEYQVDDYYETIKHQMKKIKEDLEKIRNGREVHRQTRYTSGFCLVSLAGYTNAGKSSLLNLLTGETVKVEGKLFSTLSTTTRKINSSFAEKNIPVLLTDTVGFIENLPSWVIDAFHSTLEEIEVADVVLLVVDGSEPEDIVEKKLRVSLRELQDLGVAAPVLIVFNKIDLITQEQSNQLVSSLHQKGVVEKKSCVFISVLKQKNISRLLDLIYSSLPHMVTLRLHLPSTKESQAFVSFLYDSTQVTSVQYDQGITLLVRCNEKIKEKIFSRCRELGGHFF